MGYHVVGDRQDSWTYVDDRGDTVVVLDEDWVLAKEL
jgi:hypothetical protein